MREILDLISVQRHDFLNHLQVISGLLQLNKPEKALDYIKQISYLAGQDSYICRINNSDLALRLMLEQHKAAQRGIELEIIVLQFSEVALPERLLSQVIGQLVQFAMDQCKETDDYCQLRLLSDDQCGRIELEFPDRLGVAGAFLSEIHKDMYSYGVKVDCRVEESLCQLCLQLPKMQTNVAG